MQLLYFLPPLPCNRTFYLAALFSLLTLSLTPSVQAQLAQEIPLAALYASMDEASYTAGSGESSPPQIRWPNGEYRESHTDLRVKILGGHLNITRTWQQGRWWLNPAWPP